MTSVNLEKLVSLCKRRGFIFQSSEIYGGLASTWDYGPLGVELKRNLKESWWRSMVWSRDDMVGLDSAILMHPTTWKASGHLQSFSDPLVECKDCHQRWREDQLDKSSCPYCNGNLTDSRNFNLMFKTFMGPVEEDASTVFLRPETAQGIFVNFNNVLSTTRKKLPFGIAQIGKAFRNEITTGNFIFRTREFEMMEIEYFVNPGDDEDQHQKWIDLFINWYLSLGLNKERLRVRPHAGSELSHYSKATHDIEYHFPWGWGEIQGIANRTDYDLKAHTEASGESLTYFDTDSNQHITPYVIEPSAGVDRAVMALLVDSYTEQDAPTASGGSEIRTLLKLHHSLAPVKVAILPLSRKENVSSLARDIHQMLRVSNTINGFIQYDDSQSIGRRYRRQDEIGTPLCITIDFESLEDNSVTIRDRDTMKQERVAIKDLQSELEARLRIVY